jgi:hypothetical protein
VAESNHWRLLKKFKPHEEEVLRQIRQTVAFDTNAS